MGARFSAPVQTGPGGHPASYTMGTGSFPEVKSGRGVGLTPHPLLVLWSRKCRTIPLHHLWTVRPVQSLSACTRVHFTFAYSSGPSKRNKMARFCVYATKTNTTNMRGTQKVQLYKFLTCALHESIKTNKRGKIFKFSLN